MTKSNLLINEPPLQVLPKLATKIGLNEAIIIQQLHYWLNNPKSGVIIDGKKWVYNTYEEWQKDNFPFWSVNTIQRIFSKLEESGLIIAEQLRRAEYDRTKYYRIDYIKLSSIEDTNLVSSEDTNLVSSTILTETTTETTTTSTSKEDDEDIKQSKPNIYKLYEGQFGVLTASIAEVLKAAEETYPALWIDEAIKMAAINNVHRWSYCQKILREWKVNGKETRQTSYQKQGRPERLPSGV